MNKNDKKLYKKLNQNINIPQSHLNNIYNTLNNLTEKKYLQRKSNKLKLSIVTACSSLFLITGVVFSKDIKIFFNGILNKSVISAIENDYIEVIPSDTIIKNNITTYIDSILMDDYKMYITINFELPSTYKTENITKIQIPNLLIYDENENILFNEFYEEINYNFFNINNIKQINKFWKFGYDISCLKENHTYSLTYVVENKNFPNSQKINIKFDKINLLNDNLINDLETEKRLNLTPIERIKQSTIDYIEGNWFFSYDLTAKTYSRENLIYKITNYNNYNYNFPSEIIVSITETPFSFQYNQSDFSNDKNISLNNEAYIITQNGERLGTINTEQELINNIINCHYVFELGKFNATEIMTLIIPINDGTNIELELKKEN